MNSVTKKEPLETKRPRDDMNSSSCRQYMNY